MALAREKEFTWSQFSCDDDGLGADRFQLPDVTCNQMASLLNVTLPHQLADSLLRDPNSYDRTVEMPATIVFADIQGFTQTVEALNGDLVTLKSYLSQAMDAVVQVHRKHDLIIDKYIGDCIMAFRGGDLVEGCTRPCLPCRAGLSRSAGCARRHGEPILQQDAIWQCLGRGGTH